MYFHVLCTFELLLQDQDGTSSLLKLSLLHKLGWLLLSFFAINYFLCGMCLFGWWGVSTAMHTLSGLLTGSENYLASLEIFQTAGSDNRKLCLWNNVYMQALKWRQKHKHYYKCINSFKSMIWSFAEPQLDVRLLRVHPFRTVCASDVNFYPVILRWHRHYQANNIFIVVCTHLAAHCIDLQIVRRGMFSALTVWAQM